MLAQTTDVPSLNITTLDEKYSRYVNPQWVKLLSVLGINRQFVRAFGAELIQHDKSEFWPQGLRIAARALGHK